jgi:hypothetical protein
VLKFLGITIKNWKLRSSFANLVDTKPRDKLWKRITQNVLKPS